VKKWQSFRRISKKRKKNAENPKYLTPSPRIQNLSKITAAGKIPEIKITPNFPLA